MTARHVATLIGQVEVIDVVLGADLCRRGCCGTTRTTCARAHTRVSTRASIFAHTSVIGIFCARVSVADTCIAALCVSDGSAAASCSSVTATCLCYSVAAATRCGYLIRSTFCARRASAAASCTRSCIGRLRLSW
jgi:hypothetical protein